MAYLVAGFLLNMDNLDAFICLANFINQPFNLAFYITDRSQVCTNFFCCMLTYIYLQMFKYTNTADGIISTLLPKIHKHFQEVQIEPEHYLVDWYVPLNIIIFAFGA